MKREDLVNVVENQAFLTLRSPQRLLGLFVPGDIPDNHQRRWILARLDWQTHDLALPSRILPAGYGRSVGIHHPRLAGLQHPVEARLGPCHGGLREYFAIGSPDHLHTGSDSLIRRVDHRKAQFAPLHHGDAGTRVGNQAFQELALAALFFFALAQRLGRRRTLGGDFGLSL